MYMFYLVILGIFINAHSVISEECLKNLRVENSRNTSVNLVWDYDCEVDSVTFKIYWEHIEWKACNPIKKDTARGPGFGHIEIENDYGANIFNLHPYSIYEFEIKAIPSKRSGISFESKKIKAETLSGIPEVIPKRSNIPHELKDTSVKLYWTSPNARTECQRFNGELDEYFVILKGLDTWNQGVRIEESTSDFSIKFSNLMPYSHYNLYVYAKTRAGDYNENLYFLIPAIETVHSKKAGTPRDLTAIVTYDGPYHITWLPPYPPTGYVTKYKLRWKEAESSVWSQSAPFLPTSDVCSDDSYAKEEYNKRVCHTLPESKFVNYDKVEFQVAAINVGSENTLGDWTDSVIAVPDEEKSNNSKFLGIIIILSIVVPIFVILITIYFCRRRIKKRRNSYKNVPHYDRQSNSLHGQTVDGRRPFSMPPSLPPPYTPPGTLNSVDLRRTESSATNTTELSKNSKYQHLFVPVPKSDSRPGSIQGIPLPPLPTKSDPIYEELCQDTLLSKQNKKPIETSIRVSFNPCDDKNASEDEDDFLKPTNASCTNSPTDSDGYLTPSSVKKQRPRSKSFQDDAEYLKPTFNQFTRINSRDLTPPQENPPPIPMESYVPVRKHSE